MARGDIWLVEFPSPEGALAHEQIGDRPGIVVQTDAGDQRLPTTLVYKDVRNLF
jgi:mRNA-degrading endonuclease toxin of MazEF toxin-antitoxin module